MEVLGQGAFATAYRGYLKATGQEVAIKIVSLDPILEIQGSFQ